MAPGGYLSTYRAYKNGTNRLVSWLARAAKRCGVDDDVFDGNKVPLKYFVKIAKIVADSTAPKINIPAAILALTKSVIGLRKQQGKLLVRLTGTTTNHASHQSHRHFITVLESVLGILQSATTETLEGNGTTNLTDEGGAEPSISNMFAALSVEDPIVAENAEDESTAQATKPSKKQTSDYRLDISPEDDMLVAIIACLNDINDIREVIKQIWKDYNIGKIDIMNAAVTTDTALGTIRRICDDVAEAIPGEEKYYAMLEKLTGGAIRSGSVESGNYSDDLVDWLAIPTERLLSEFSDVLEGSHIPVYKPGHLGYYHPEQDRSTLSDFQKHHENRIILMEMLPEIAKIALLRNDLALDDELTAVLKVFIAARDIGKTPMHAIFCTHIFLDIHHILRSNAIEPFNELQETGRRTIAAIDRYFAFTGTNQVATWPQHNDEGLRWHRQNAERMALTDVVGNVKVRGLASVGAPPFHFFKRHPLLCGLYIFRLNLDMQETGITLVGAWGSVMYPIHLYNACRQSRAYERAWEDAEYIYQIHTQQRILVGDPPAKPDEYLKRFVLALGGSAANFARNRRRELADTVQKSKKGPRGLKMTTPVKDIFQKRYTQGGQAVLSTPNMVAMLGIAARSVRPCKPSLDIKAFARNIVAQPQLTPVQLLTCVREGMAAEEMHLLFDYLGLHQRGYALLSNLRLHLHQDLVRFCGSEEYVESASQLPYIVGYLFELLCASRLSSDQLGSPAHGSQALVKAADVLRDFLEDGSQGKEGKMGAFKRTRTAKWAVAMHMEDAVLRGIWDPQKLAAEESGRSEARAGAAT